MSDAAAPPAPAGARPTRGALGVVFATVFLDLLGFGLIIPIQAYYAQSFGARPAVITLVGASYSLMQFLFMPMWGRLSDRIGRRPVVLASVAMSALGFAWFAAAQDLWMLFAARMLAGFGNANIGAAQAVIADTTRPEERAKGMGLIGLAFGLGFVIGPAVGGGLAQFGLPVPAWAAAGLAAANLVFAWRFLPETLPPSARGKALDAGAARRAVIALPGVRRLIAVSFVLVTGFAMMEQIVALLIEHVWVPEALVASTAAAGHARAARLTTVAMLVVGLTMAAVQGGLVGRLVRSLGELRLVRVGALVVVAGLVAMPLVALSASWPAFLVTCGWLAVGQSVTTPAVTGLLSRAVGPDRQGTALGIGQSMAALARVIGPAAAGTLFEWDLRAPYWCGALLVALALGILVGLKGAGERRL